MYRGSVSYKYKKITTITISTAFLKTKSYWTYFKSFTLDKTCCKAILYLHQMIPIKQIVMRCAIWYSLLI